MAARPFTPAQLASACVLAGFDIILPPSTGDEIVAATYLSRLTGCSDAVVVACACPRVRDRLKAMPSATRRCVSVASPAVAAARYLRATHGDHVLITYVGDCPGATDPAIDARFSPTGFLASLHRQGIELGDQPDLDRHHIAWGRHLSMPGGMPARRYLARAPIDRVVREIAADALDAESAPHRSPVFVDIVDAECVCGARRDDLMDVEPPRSSMALFAIPEGLDANAERSLPRSRPSLRARHGLTAATSHGLARSAAAAVPVEPTAATPDAPGRPATAPGAVRDVVSAGGRDAARSEGAARASESRAARSQTGGRRSPLLLLLPIAVLAGATALGVAAYATGSGGTTSASAGDAMPRPRADSGHTPPRVDAMGAGRPGGGESRGLSPQTSLADSGRRPGGRPDDTATPSETSATARRRPRRARPPEIIPGWLPQGQPTWVPDSLARRRPDSVSSPTPDRRPPA